ncbi:unnamed protein product [Rotaria socialis]|uniref:Uncharacterized protein n=1 Tax=Rotaria socialis TaxID=392032 RepID=A0A820MF23_9BILA|nr:unnamed protein product [Rotaria socialis]CAF4370955.1 unnamed protein product [Rotaria socialis]
MEDLHTVYVLNKRIEKLRMRAFKLTHDDSRRAIQFDWVVLQQLDDIRTSLDGMARTRGTNVKRRYSYKTLTAAMQHSTIDAIPILLVPPKFKITTMIIGAKVTAFKMTPAWFKLDDEAKVLKNIIYPANIANKRPFNTIARYRAVIGKTNDFSHESLLVSDDQTETLVLALDAFARQFGGDLSFTNEDLSFEESAHCTACGVANLSSAHLLATNYVPTAKLTFEIGIAYKELAKSEETMQNFAMSFVQAIVDVLSCENDYIRILSINLSSKSKGQVEVSFGITTPSQEKTEEYVRILQEHARSGFLNNKILRLVKPSEYECTWSSVLSFLQLRPEDFDSKHNFDYRQPDLPESLTRGGYPYYLPMGWYRHAIKVNNKYGDGDAWLGSTNAPGEWPVAFHGTHSGAVSGITAQGLLIKVVQVDLKRPEAIEQMGEAADKPGLYLATHCNGGSHSTYTRPFDVQTSQDLTKSFRVVFQCRVKPGTFTTHKSPVKVGDAWRVVDPDAVRPYGILLKDEEITVPD